MTNKTKMSKNIESLQNSSDFVILNNPLASPKFVRRISKTETKAISVKEIYAPKLFFEVASRLKPADLEQIKMTESVAIEINIKQFAEAIGSTNSSNFYTDIRNTAEYLSDLKMSFIGNDGLLTTVGVFNKTKTDEKGKIIVFVDGELAQRILDVREKGNFSFLKEYIFGLKTGQAIKLYPFFKSWLNHGRYETGLDRFKEQFGYNTKGYTRFNRFVTFVLEPATKEINEKTDIIVTYETTGENLDGLRPRVTGLIFWITAKEKTKILPTGQVHTATPKATIEPTPEPIEATPPQEQPKHATAQAVATANPNEPTTEEITAILSKIDPKITPEQVAVLVEFYSPVRLWEMAKQASIEHKKTPIKNLIGFIKSSADMLGLGLWKKEKEKAKQEQEKAEKVKAEQATKKLLEQITTKYKEDKANYIKAQYEKATEEQKAEAVEMVWNEQSNKRILFQNENKATPNSYGKEKIKELVAFPEGYNERAWIKNHALKTFGVQVDFDQDGQMILASLVNAPIEGEPVEIGVFDRKRAAAQTPKVAEKIEEPQTPPPPQEQEPEIVPNKSVHEDEQTETPKGIGALLSKFKWK